MDYGVSNSGGTKLAWFIINVIGFQERCCVFKLKIKVIFYLRVRNATIHLTITNVVEVLRYHTIHSLSYSEYCVIKDLPSFLIIPIKLRFSTICMIYTSVLGCPDRGPAPGTPRRDPDVSGVGAGRG